MPGAQRARVSRIFMLSFPLYISILAGATSLARGVLGAGEAQPARWILFFGLFWALAQFKRWHWFAPIALLVSLAAAGYGLWLDLSAHWMAAGALGALFAWDLSDFSRRLKVSAPDGAYELTQRHLLRLSLLTALALVYSVLRMIYWWEFFLESLAYLGILAALGAAIVAGRIQRTRD